MSSYVCLSFLSQAARLYEFMLDWMDSAGTRIAGAIREADLRFGANQIGYTLPPCILASSVTQYQSELQIPKANT